MPEPPDHFVPFRTCSTCPVSQSKHIYNALSARFPDRAYVPRTLRYTLGGDRPQSNRPPYTVPNPDNGKVRTSNTPGWYFNVGSTELSVLASKPPTYPTDLFKVQCKATVKVHGVFPSFRREIASSKHFNFAESLRRQCGHHYAIRAGRNLPDKEFRYLRTVIVTAAVYWDFNQELAPHHLIFQHRAGVTPYTSTFVFAECCVFIKQLQPPILCRTSLGSPSKWFTY